MSRFWQGASFLCVNFVVPIAVPEKDGNFRQDTNGHSHRGDAAQSRLIIDKTSEEDCSTGPAVQLTSVKHLATRLGTKGESVDLCSSFFYQAFCVSNVMYRWRPRCLLEAALNNNLWLMILYNRPLCALTHVCTGASPPLMNTTTERLPNGLIFHGILRELIRVRGRFVLPIFSFQVWRAWN